MEVKGGLAEALLGALGDEVSRKIMEFAIENPRTVAEMSTSLGISPSTCYRRVNELESQGVLVVEQITLLHNGKFASFRSCFSSSRVISTKDGTSVEVVLNADVAERVRNRWTSIAYNQSGGIAP